MTQSLIGIATWNYGGGSLAERIERFAAMGYNAVSLIASDARSLALGTTPEVEAAILSHSLAVAVHGGIKGATEEETLSDLDAYLRWHERTGALRTVNYDPCWVEKPEGGRDYDAGYMRSMLARLLEMSAGTGVTIGIEDWPRTPGHLASVEDLPGYPHYGVLVDLGHLNMRIRREKEVDASSFAEAAAAYLRGFTLPINELHVHNNNGERDQHAPPVMGTADIAALARMVRRMNVRGPSTIEIVPAWSGLSEEEGWKAAADSVPFWRQAFASGDD